MWQVKLSVASRPSFSGETVSFGTYGSQTIRAPLFTFECIVIVHYNYATHHCFHLTRAQVRAQAKSLQTGIFLFLELDFGSHRWCFGKIGIRTSALRGLFCHHRDIHTIIMTVTHYLSIEDKACVLCMTGGSRRAADLQTRQGLTSRKATDAGVLASTHASNSRSL